MKRVSTRVLLVCAAIAVAQAILLVPMFNIFSTAAIAGAPFAYSALLGLWFFGGVLAQTLTHRPGVAVLVTLVAGLVLIPVTPLGIAVLGSVVTVGVLQELPFAVTLYRKWPTWLFYVWGGLVGGVYGALTTRFLAEDSPVWVAPLCIALSALSALVATFFSRFIAARLLAAGVARGLKPTRSAAPTQEVAA